MGCPLFLESYNLALFPLQTSPLFTILLDAFTSESSIHLLTLGLSKICHHQPLSLDMPDRLYHLPCIPMIWELFAIR